MKTFENFIETYNFPKHFTETTINAMKIIAKDAWETCESNYKISNTSNLDSVLQRWDNYKKISDNNHKDFVMKYTKKDI